jgi:hypothetical protein
MEPNPFLRNAWYVAAWEDEPIFIAQQEAMNAEDFWDLKPLILAGDAGAIRARRILRKLINAERDMQVET